MPPKRENLFTFLGWALGESKSQNNMEGTPPLRGVPYPTF
jgi:hypothetical protein